MQSENNNFKSRIIQALNQFLALGFAIKTLLENTSHLGNWQHNSPLFKLQLLQEIHFRRCKGLEIHTSIISSETVLALVLVARSATEQCLKRAESLGYASLEGTR